MAELYKFTTPDNTYYYNNTTADISYQSQDYKALPIRRTTVGRSAASGSESTFNISNIPINEPIIQDIINTKFEGLVNLEIANFSNQVYTVIYNGNISGIVLSGEFASVEIESHLKTVLDREIPTRLYQKTCPYRLGDNFCRRDLTTYTITTTIQRIEDDLTTIHLTPVSTTNLSNYNSSNYFTLGILTVTANDNRRTILSQDNWKFTINRPFLQARVGSQVSIQAGCDKKISTCHNKFNNVDWFGGQNTIPNKNLAVIGNQTAAAELGQTNSNLIDSDGNRRRDFVN